MNRFNRFMVLAGSLVCLAACQTTGLDMLNKSTETVEAKLPVSWQIAVDQGSIPQNWPSLFGDQLLADYMTKADQNNADIGRAIIRVRQAEAGLRESRSILLPILRTDFQMSGLAALSNLDNVSDSYGGGLSASWDPGLFGRNAIEIDQAQNLLGTQTANQERVRRVVMARIASSYIQIIETDQQLALSKTNLEFIGETLRISKARFDAGDIARDGLSLASLEYENALSNVESLDLTSRNLRRSFAVLIGDNPDANLTVAASLPRAADLNLSAQPMEVLGRRFDVAASRARIANSFAGVQQAERLNWPSLSLSGRVNGSSLSPENLFDIDSYISSLGASLASILFDNGRKDARIDNAKAGLDEALINYDEILRNALLDVESGFDRIAAARRSLAALERGSVAAAKALELEKIKYDLGESIILDVLTVQRRVNAIQASYISLQRRLLEAQIDTYLALGGDAASIQ